MDKLSICIIEKKCFVYTTYGRFSLLYVDKLYIRCLALTHVEKLSIPSIDKMFLYICHIVNFIHVV